MSEYERTPSSRYDPDAEQRGDDERPGRDDSGHHDHHHHDPPPEPPPESFPPPVPPPVIGYGGSGLPAGRGPIILTLGIIGVCLDGLACCCAPTGVIGLILSIGAVALGAADRRAIREGRIDPEQQGIVTTGWILGIVLGILWSGFAILNIVFQFAGPSWTGGFSGF